MPQNLRDRRLREFGHTLLVRGGLRAYALALPLLGFKCTWYKIKSRDKNEKGKDFIFYKKKHICLQQALMVHCTWPWCVHSVPAPYSHPSSRSACTHTVALATAAWAEGWRGACSQMYSSYFVLMIDLSLSATLDMSLKHELYGLNYVLHLQKVPK